MKRLKFKNPLVLISAGLVVVGVCSVVLIKPLSYRIRYPDPGQRELKRITDQISKAILLPEGEPTLATVTDKSKLAKGGVLKNAENGDKVLLYYNDLKAYLYRPALGKVIDSGPIILDPSASEVAGTTILIRNGGDVEEAARSMQQALKDRYQTANLETKVAPAARQDYPVTIVIDLTENRQKSSFAESIAEYIGGQVGILPIGEQKPEGTDILIIVGQDAQ